MILKRLKNLWKLSAYRVDDYTREKKLIKDFPTIKRKMATIIKPEVDVLNEDIENDSTS